MSEAKVKVMMVRDMTVEWHTCTPPSALFGPEATSDTPLNLERHTATLEFNPSTGLFEKQVQMGEDTVRLVLPPTLAPPVRHASALEPGTVVMDHLTGRHMVVCGWTPEVREHGVLQLRSPGAAGLPVTRPLLGYYQVVKLPGARAPRPGPSVPEAQP